jgi:hypothetical protein
MAFKTEDGKQRYGNRMKANRYDREHKPEEKPAEPKMEPKMEKMGGEEQAEEQVHPGIHEEIKGIVAQHGPAHEIHMAHDHAGMKSMTHSVHEDGHEHQAQHDGEEHAMHAHHHAMHAAGMTPPEEPEPGEHESPEVDNEDYEPEIE